MTHYTAGSKIRIPCKVDKGPFENEVTVEFDSLDGKVSGFTSRDNISEERGQHYIRGVVRSINGRVVTVMVSGSFFTTNGLADFQDYIVEPLPLAA